MSPDLFSYEPPTEGRRLAQEGIERAEAHANRVEDGWSDQAHRYLRDFLSVGPSYFMAEDVRRFAEPRGLPSPPDPRAWGGVMQRASRAGLIAKSGYAESSNKQAHCRPTQMWRR